MYKKHDYLALIKYIKLLEEGYSIYYISKHYGMDNRRLKRIWNTYQETGEIDHERKKQDRSLRKEPFKGTLELKQQILHEIEKKEITLHQASSKYGVHIVTIRTWIRKIKAQKGTPLIEKKRGRPKNMRKQNKKTELYNTSEVKRLKTENQALQERNKELEIQIELIKKVNALFKERYGQERADGR